MHDDENRSHDDGADVSHEAPVDSSTTLEDAGAINMHDDVTEVETQPTHLEPPDEHRATRTRSQPTRFQDFEVDLTPSINHPPPPSDRFASTVHPLTHYVSYQKISPSHKAFLAAIVLHNEPKVLNRLLDNPNGGLQCIVK